MKNEPHTEESGAADAGAEAGSAAPGKTLSPAARRALREAAERRLRAQPESAPGKEINGPRGPEPTRYGDWERKGRVSDF